VIRFDKSLEDYGPMRRRVEVSKMRGVPVADGYHDMAIREGQGVVVFPRIVPGAETKTAKPT
jgi:circadian clock protein KaiC